MNPYYADGVDDDLFEDTTVDGLSAHGHALDGSVCERCFREHDMSDVPESHLPHFVSLLKMMPERAVVDMLNEKDFGSHLPSQVGYGWLKGSSILVHEAAQDPLKTATTQLLNEMTDGRLTLLWKVYETERQIIINHSILQATTEYLQMVRDLDTSEYSAKGLLRVGHTIHVVDFICDLMVERSTSAYQKYLRYCEEAEIEAKSEEDITSMKSQDASDPSIKIMLKKLEHGIQQKF